MKYSDIRSEIKSGDVLAWTHRSWKTFYDLQVQAVRFATQSEYCHVATAWVEGGRVWVIESVSPLVRIIPLSNVAGDGFYWLPMGDEMTTSELEFSLSKVGNGEYSKMLGVKAHLSEIDINDETSWQCAKFVIASKRKSNIDLGTKATPTAVVRVAQEIHSAPCYFVSP